MDISAIPLTPVPALAPATVGSSWQQLPAAAQTPQVNAVTANSVQVQVPGSAASFPDLFQAAALGSPALVPEAGQSLQAMFRGVYMAPVVARFYAAPYRRGLSATAAESLEEIAATMAAAAPTEYANGQPFNPSDSGRHAEIPETASAHLHRLAGRFGLVLTEEQLVSATYGAVARHRLDVVA